MKQVASRPKDRSFRRWSAGIAATAVLLALGIGGVPASAAMPDPSFGEDGYSFIGPPPPGISISSAYGLTMDSSNRLIVTGRGGIDNGGQFYAARVMPDGSPDGTFGDGGLALTDFFGPLNGLAVGTAAVVQQSGKIVVTGFEGSGNPIFRLNQMALARFNADGSVDYPFSGGKDAGWKDNSRAYFGAAISQGGGGKFLVASTGSGSKKGWADYGLVNRYDSEGRADPTFNGGVRSRRSGQIKIAAGIHRSINLEDMILMHGGKILLGGIYGGRFMVVRLRRDGSYDNSFARRGIATVDVNGKGDCACRATVKGIARTSQGKILLAGHTYSPDGKGPYLVLARLTANGKVDRSFGRNGIARLKLDKGIRANDVAVQPDGRIVVVGTSGLYMTVVRFTPDGRLDRSFFRNGLFRTSVLGGITVARKVLIDRAGRIVVAGGDDDLRFAFLLRILPNAGR